MDISKEDAIIILSKNCGYPISKTVLGNAVQMSAKEAFLFANVTGAGYFDDPTLLFSPKGTQKILREAFQYNLVAGISPAELNLCRPYLFCGQKYVVFEEFADECTFSEDLKHKFNMLTEQGIKTTDFVIARIEASKKGNGMEPFLEYLACEHFKRQGFVVENQVPLRATVGSPDFAGYKIDNKAKGFHINELSLIRLFKNYEIAEDLYCSDMIVGEAKTATRTMENQLKKYLNTGFFSKGYELHPDKPFPSIDSFGLLNIDSAHNVVVIDPLVEYKPPVNNNKLSKKEYKHWITNYFKYYLIANFTKKEFTLWVQSKLEKKNITVKDIVSFVNKLSIEQILKKIKEV